ncbi:ferredoxin [Pseudosporangium ferrugineum]|uniref:Ferredoxin n=1 Tax=Pseudosporangium ferrugineum TaxID=439699 RepID=A0A2T0RKJ9_9ACTN|nr:(4Fe-4S)-binding protein [Pseudosporangium ferrugineum]PRY21709.1 ferredoxin [Pseudosporangium ferrugineum]
MTPTQVQADRELCIGAGNCVRILPTLFDQDPDGLVTLLTPTPTTEPPDLLHRAATLCPSGAITLTESPHPHHSPR